MKAINSCIQCKQQFIKFIKLFLYDTVRLQLISDMDKKNTNLFGFSEGLQYSFELNLPMSKSDGFPSSKCFLQTFSDLDDFFLDNDTIAKKFPKLLKSKIEKHPVPRNQGPLLPILHLMSADIPSWEQAMKFHTAFQHDPKQKCAKWTVGSRNIFSICNIYEVSDFSPSETFCSGPFSRRETMSGVYTCIYKQCSVECPCKLCSEIQSLPCRSLCRSHPCQDCEKQCRLHSIEFERTFDIKKHAFSIKTDGGTAEKYVLKHAGIPKDCRSCADNLLDHQLFHLLPHQLCKFCRQLSQPGDTSTIPIIKVDDYIKAKSEAKSKIEKTCSQCYKVFGKVSKRIAHETTQHGDQVRDFACNDCEEKFSNKNALIYHWTINHDSESVPKIMCEVCNECFISKVSLKEHRETTHKDSNILKCDYCDASFTLKTNLLRHMKLLHVQAQSHKSEGPKFTCEVCAINFSRRDNLSRHLKRKHGPISDFVFECTRCLKIFHLKSNCDRHVKMCVV